MDFYITRAAGAGIRWITDCPWGADPVTPAEAWKLLRSRPYDVRITHQADVRENLRAYI